MARERWSRREILLLGLVLSGMGPPSGLSRPRGNGAPATPECNEHHNATPTQSSGPYYQPDSPLKSSFVNDAEGGTRLVLRGFVVDLRCRPIPNALLDFWQADQRGIYDNEGYRLRGHQYADEHGRYVLETIVPGRYPGRTKHIHVRVQPSSGAILTTQIYFPGEASNDSDGQFRTDLLVTKEIGTAVARFDFVLST